jgi:hydroxymethylbilane synthase
MNPASPLRLGTRGSPLALAQARMVADALLAAHGWEEGAVAIIPITTTGDVVQDRPLAEIGGKALWTKELDRALRDQRIDMAVHSMKDVETERPPSFGFAAMLPRADTRDRLIGAASLDELPQGARIGTSSPRRAAQLRARRPDLETFPIRGNVETRLDKVAKGDFDATLLAAAGLDRLGMPDIGSAIPNMLTAPGQGAVGIEILWAREDVRALVAAIDDRPAHTAVMAEREFLLRLGGNCHSAVAARADVHSDGMEMSAEILLPDGSEVQARTMELNGSSTVTPADLAALLLADASPALRATFGA